MKLAIIVSEAEKNDTNSRDMLSQFEMKNCKFFQILTK